jgi:hypothetical protein
MKVSERTFCHDKQLFGLRSIAALRLQARDPLLEFADLIFGVRNAFGNAHAIRRNIPHESLPSTKERDAKRAHHGSQDLR